MITDNPNAAEFASWYSYKRFARSVSSENRYILGLEEKAFLETVLSTIRDRDVELATGEIFYRAQLGVDLAPITDSDGNYIDDDVCGYPAKRMKPLADRAREGRANPTGIPVLYVADTVETAVSEVRPWVGADLSVAECRVLRPLNTLDLSVGHGRSSFSGPVLRHMLGGPPLSKEEKENAVWTDIDNAFSQPVTHSDDRADYAPTQMLAELFRKQGYDAIRYKSQFGDAEQVKGYNIAIFNPDDVEIVSCGPYKVKSIKVTSQQTGQEWHRSPIQ